MGARKTGSLPRSILKVGNLAKYRQTESLRSLLLGTGGIPLAEGCKDRYWGIGWDIDDTRLPARSPANGWTAQNEMGTILSEVRSVMVAEAGARSATPSCVVNPLSLPQPHALQLYRSDRMWFFPGTPEPSKLTGAFKDAHCHLTFSNRLGVKAGTTLAIGSRLSTRWISVP